MKKNITLFTDSYKIGHWNMYPDNNEKVYSYFESRKGAKFNKTILFGLQYLMKEYLEGCVVTQEKIDYTDKLMSVHLEKGSFNREGWEYILKEHGGKLPLRIKAVPEGMPITTNNVLITVENVDPIKCDFLTNFVESLLTHVWSSSAVATFSREVKMVCNHYLGKTSDSKEGLDFMLHDFGYRAASSNETAGICGAGHLVNFSGTDTIIGLMFAMDYYKSPVCAFSVPATEHSVMTARGRNGEMDVVRDLLKKYPAGILSVVIDSYNYIDFINNVGKMYKNEIMNRDGKFVFRPDSGEPITTTLKVLELLEENFGSSLNSKGYKILPSTIGVLWGDGIGYVGIRNVLHVMKENGWAASNIVFGMGGDLLQKHSRDDQMFAFKCSAQKRDGIWHDIYKEPLETSKTSKKGKQYLYKNQDGGYYTTNVKDESKTNILQTVFENGKIVKEITFEEVRNNAKLDI